MPCTARRTTNSSAAMPSTRWSRPTRSRSSPPRSTTSQRRAFRSSPLPRGRCCSSTRVSKRGRRSWCAVRRAASAPARRRWRRKPAPASTEPRAPGTSNGCGRWVPSRSWKAIALARNWPPGPSMLLSTPSAVTHSKAPAGRCARTGSSSPSCAPRTRPMSGREACARRISSSTSRATGSTGSRRWSNAERLTCQSARFSTSQTRAPPTACWMARLTSPERSCSRSQTDRGGPAQRSEVVSEQMARTPGPTLQETIPMKAIVVTDQAAGTAGIKLLDRPEPAAAINDVVVQVHASGFTWDELTWPSTWTDRLGRDRTPVIPGQELAGVVSALGYGTTGLSVGQRVFGLTDSYRGGTLAEYVAVEARNLAPLPGDVDFTVGASVAMPGLTAWQGLFQHGRLQAGQSVLVHGAAGAVGSMVTQLAADAGAYVIGTGRAADRQKALDFGAMEFVDLENDALEDVGEVHLVFDVIGGDILKRSARLIRAGGTLVSIVGPAEARPVDGLAIDFVLVSDRAQLSEIVQRVRDGRLRTNIGNVSTLDDAVAAFNPTARISGKTIIRVRP